VDLLIMTITTSYDLMQFDVDNAISIERSVSILLSHIPNNSTWVKQYLGVTYHKNIIYTFFCEYLNSIETISDLELLREFLQITRFVPDRWILKRACDTHSQQILEILLEVEGVEEHIDDWICLYVYTIPSMFDALMQKKSNK
jgi:hypothetical protein